MKLDTILMMILLLSLSWGGFVFCLILAIKKEEAKKKNVL